MGIRFALAAVISAFISVASGSAFANTIYNVNISRLSNLPDFRTSLTGTITTDSTLGTLSTANIVSFHLIGDVEGALFDLNSAGITTFFVAGDGLRATKKGLFFDFSRTDHSFVLFESLGRGQVCFNDATASCDNIYASLISIDPADSLDVGFLNPDAGKIASVAPTPLPGAFVLLGSALGGLGFVGWRRRPGTTPA